MAPVYRYTRGVRRRLVRRRDRPAEPVQPGELVAHPGKKHRTYRAPVQLGPDNKPIRPKLYDVTRRQAQVFEDNWLATLLTLTKPLAKGDAP